MIYVCPAMMSSAVGRILKRGADVVDPFHEDDVRDTRLREHVVLEARKRIDSGLKCAVAAHAVAGNARVHQADPDRVGVLGQEQSPMVLEIATPSHELFRTAH
jgi:hypothetical protein